MTVDSNHATGLILVLLRFFIGFIKWCRNHSTNQKQSKDWYWVNWPIKSMSKTLIGIGFASHQVQHHLLRVALHFIHLSSINTNSMLFLYFFFPLTIGFQILLSFDLLFSLKQKRQKSHNLSVWLWSMCMTDHFFPRQKSQSNVFWP